MQKTAQTEKVLYFISFIVILLDTINCFRMHFNMIISMCLIQQVDCDYIYQFIFDTGKVTGNTFHMWLSICIPIGGEKQTENNEFEQLN